MSFEVEGKLIKKYETESKSEKFQAREFVLEVASGNYPEFVKFQLTQDRCSLIDAFSEGEQMKVHFDLRGREWQGKYFTNLNAWRVEKVSQGTADAPAAASGDGSFPSASDEPSFSSAASSDDDLPF
jgi:single-strand DNA-binding protein